MKTYLRWNKKSAYSLAALAPLINFEGFTSEPKEGIMVYSFSTKQAQFFYDEVLDFASNSKKTIFIAGGPHPTGSPEETLDYFDYVVIGEGEETLPELINAIQNNIDINKIEGIGYRSNSGEKVYTNPRSNVDLDTYPCFDPTHLYSPIEISRGCPWKCKYCQTPELFGSRMRHRSISSILKFSKYYSDIRFTSSNALAYGSDGIHPNLDKVELLLSSIAELGEKNIFFGTFPSEVRPEFVSDKALELVLEYCTNTSISMGAQTGSDAIMRSISRGHDVNDVIIAVERCIDHGIVPNVDFIVGFPGETPYDQMKSVELMKWICNKKGGKVHAHYFTPLPGTPYSNSLPSPVSKDVNKELGKLALKGKLTGTWQRST